MKNTTKTPQKTPPNSNMNLWNRKPADTNTGWGPIAEKQLSREGRGGFSGQDDQKPTVHPCVKEGQF